MRLRVLETEQTLPVRLKLLAIRLLSGRRAPDVVRALHYRQKRFGEPFSDWLEASMRGPSDWSIGERELFASFVSHLNQCRF
jgi:hypothetical protein